ncbi:MAG: hypothetical protein ACE5I5_05585 [Candidatus Heimdallarchaeota archaeon]
MAECQVCRAAVIVPRPLKRADGTWILVCNRCYHDQNPRPIQIHH